MTKITDLMLKNLPPNSKPVGDNSVSGLRYEPGMAKGEGKWTLRFTSPATLKRRDMGLGTYPEVGIKDARVRALEARRLIGSGQDPIQQRASSRTEAKAAAAALTFEAAARTVHKQYSPSWKNPKHTAQWLNTLEQYVFPRLGDRKVAELKAQDFSDVLRPIWLAKPETAGRVKQRCEAVMKWCSAQGLINGNPVDVVDQLLPKQPGKRIRVQHQPSMPWRDVPAFVQQTLRSGPRNVTRALLEFVILTAARSGEARAMTWDEVDLQAAVWTVPAERMKAKVAHRVPLSSRAVEIITAQRQKHPDAVLVFPAPRGGILSDMVLTGFLRDQKAQSTDPKRVATAHGFRSSFRDWASERQFSRDLAERALAHTIHNPAEAAYHRTDLLEKRRSMMEAWAQHISGSATEDNVITLLASA